MFSPILLINKFIVVENVAQLPKEKNLNQFITINISEKVNIKFADIVVNLIIAKNTALKLASFVLVVALENLKKVKRLLIGKEEFILKTLA